MLGSSAAILGGIFTHSGAFGAFDLVFFLAYMGIVLWIGFAVGRREKATVDDYFRAGGRLPWYAVGFSIIAAGTRSINFVVRIVISIVGGRDIRHQCLARAVPAINLPSVSFTVRGVHLSDRRCPHSRMRPLLAPGVAMPPHLSIFFRSPPTARVSA